VARIRPQAASGMGDQEDASIPDPFPAPSPRGRGEPGCAPLTRATRTAECWPCRRTDPQPLPVAGRAPRASGIAAADGDGGNGDGGDLVAALADRGARVRR